MDEHRSASLRSDDEQHREQVGRQAGPRRVGECHNGAVDERFHGVVRLSRNENIVAFHLDFDAEALKCVGNDAEVLERHVFDGDADADHRRQADERADFNHIGQNRVFGAAERLHTFDGEQVRGDAVDACAHRVEHLAKLLDIRLAGGVVDGCRAFCQNGSHNDVGRTRDRRFVEQHPSAAKVLGVGCLDVEDISHFVVAEGRSEVLKTEEMGVESATTDFIASGLGNDGLSEACEQRADEQHRAAQRGTFPNEFVVLQIVEIQRVGLKSIVVHAVLHDPHAHILEQLNEVFHVENVGHVFDAHLVAGQQRGTDDLQGFVFRSLRCDGSFQQATAFYDK